jgi:hypothetical protein
MEIEDFSGAQLHEVSLDFIGEKAEEFVKRWESESFWNKFDDVFFIPLKGDFIEFALLLDDKIREDMKKTFKTTRFEVISRLITPWVNDVTLYSLELKPILN